MGTGLGPPLSDSSPPNRQKNGEGDSEDGLTVQDRQTSRPRATQREGTWGKPAEGHGGAEEEDLGQTPGRRGGTAHEIQAAP